MRGKACPQSKKAGSWWQRSHQTREAVSPREPAPLLTCWWQVHPHNMSFGSLWPPLLGGHLNSHSRSCANEPCSSCLLTSPGAQRPRGPSPHNSDASRPLHDNFRTSTAHSPVWGTSQKNLQPSTCQFPPAHPQKAVS